MLIRLGRMMNVGGQISVPVIDPVITDTLDFLGPSMPSPSSISVPTPWRPTATPPQMGQIRRRERTALRP